MKHPCAAMEMQNREAPQSFETLLGYAFADSEILEEALTHASYAHESGLSRYNERLEYLGDAVLELCVSEMFYRTHRDSGEGTLTKLRARIVCESALASWAETLGLPRLLRLGKGLAHQNGRKNPSVLADAMEAVIGAVFLDGGYANAHTVVVSLAERYPPQHETPPAANGETKDAKTRLQEEIQAAGGAPPRYRLIDRTGPDHAAVFEAEVSLPDGTVLATGKGGSIKNAEFAAAAQALRTLSPLRAEGTGKGTKEVKRP